VCYPSNNLLREPESELDDQELQVLYILPLDESQKSVFKVSRARK